MPNLDETELAWLLDLYNKAESEPWNPLDDQDYIEAACNAVPALVAEIRRLREALNTFIEEDQSRVILVQQQMLDCLREKVEAWRDAAEFEATVASKLTRLDAEDLPCANSMVMFCPKPPFWGRNCGPWCILRMARLDAEEEMERHADRE